MLNDRNYHNQILSEVFHFFKREKLGYKEINEMSVPQLESVMGRLQLGKNAMFSNRDKLIIDGNNKCYRLHRIYIYS